MNLFCVNSHDGCSKMLILSASSSMKMDVVSINVFSVSFFM